jgi:hypothetical protein
MLRSVKSVVVLVLVLAIIPGIARAVPTVTVNACLASQLKIVGKGAAAVAGCCAKAATKGVATDGTCLSAAADKVAAAVAKLESKKICLVEGDGASLASAALAWADDVDALVGHAPGKCDGPKTKLVGKYVAALQGCHAKAATKSGTVDGTCVSKAAAKLAGGITKAELRTDCSTTGQGSSLASAADAFATTQVCALDPASHACVPPTPIPTSTPIPTPTPMPTATLTAHATSTPVPALTATPTPFVTPGCGNGVPEPGETCESECAADEACGDCACACPTRLVIAADPVAPGTMLEFGWTGWWHGMPLVTGGDLTVGLYCSAVSSPCGECVVSGPIPNDEPGQLANRRCTNDSSQPCSADSDCAARTCLGGVQDGEPCANAAECPSGTCPEAGTCAFNMGPPMPLSAGGASVCVVNQVAGAISGTLTLGSGAGALSMRLSADVYAESAIDHPCPRCSDTGPINDGVADGTCLGGARDGLACDANGSVPSHPDYGRTSLDCPPHPSTRIATLPIHLQNSTGTVTKTLTADHPRCRGDIPSSKCLCDTCNDRFAAPCSVNADCPPSGGVPGICGGLRCIGGGNVGSPCTATSECPSGVCGRPGAPARPDGCLEDSLSPPPPHSPDCADDDGDGLGACVLGPTVNECSAASGHPQRGCLNDADCGGSAGSCESRRRPCFLTGGQPYPPTGPYPGTGTLVAVGEESAPVAGVLQPTLASVSCIGPTNNAPVNHVVGLPGPARLAISGTLRLDH